MQKKEMANVNYATNYLKYSLESKYQFLIVLKNLST